MAKKKDLIKTEAEVLDRIGASDFRSIKKDQLISFVSSIPDMDKEVAIKCIDQFPEFKSQSIEIIEQLNIACDKLLESHKIGRKQAIESYQQILDDLSKQLNKPFITPWQKRAIIDKMIEVADKIANIHENSNNFLKEILRTVGVVSATALAAGAAILGVKIYKD